MPIEVLEWVEGYTTRRNNQRWETAWHASLMLSALLREEIGVDQLLGSATGE